MAFPDRATYAIDFRPGGLSGIRPFTGFVSAVLDAGYHVELAGDGDYNAATLRAKVAEIQANIALGVRITLNSLYISPRRFNFQSPLWQRIPQDGLPIEGFCASGIPSTEKAAEIVQS
jgi:fatty acid synthase subunit alpha, fungi type